MLLERRQHMATPGGASRWERSDWAISSECGWKITPSPVTWWTESDMEAWGKEWDYMGNLTVPVTCWEELSHETNMLLSKPISILGLFSRVETRNIIWSRVYLPYPPYIIKTQDCVLYYRDIQSFQVWNRIPKQNWYSLWFQNVKQKPEERFTASWKTGIIENTLGRGQEVSDIQDG